MIITYNFKICIFWPRIVSFQKFSIRLFQIFAMVSDRICNLYSHPSYKKKVITEKNIYESDKFLPKYIIYKNRTVPVHNDWMKYWWQWQGDSSECSKNFIDDYLKKCRLSFRGNSSCIYYVWYVFVIGEIYLFALECHPTAAGILLLLYLCAEWIRKCVSGFFFR